MLALVNIPDILGLESLSMGALTADESSPAGSSHSVDGTFVLTFCNGQRLQAHASMSKQDMSAYEPFPGGSRMVDVLVAAVDKKELGKAYKRNAKAIIDALEGMSDEDKGCLQSNLEAGKPCKVTVDGADYPISQAMVQIKQEQKKLTGR